MIQTPNADFVFRRQAWVTQRLLQGTPSHTLPFDILAGPWLDAAQAVLASGADRLGAFKTWCEQQPGSGQEYSAAVFAFAPDDPDPAKVDPYGKTSWTFDELLSTDFPEPQWAIPGILPVGLSFLSGRPKVGKSWLGLQIAHAVSTGGMVFGQKVKKGKVLYLALEDSPRRLKERLQKQGAELGTDARAETAWPTFGVEGGLSALQEQIVDKGYSLVIIDTLSRALGMADQMDIAQMTDILGNLQRIAQRYDVTILVIDHHRKSNGFASDPIDDVMGSTAKAAVGDAIMGLYKERGKQGATLKIVGRDLEERELALEWDGLTCCWQCLGEAGAVRDDSTKGEILSAIRELDNLGELPTSTNIARHIEKSQGYVSHMLADLLNGGHIAKADKQGRQQPYKVIPA